MRKPLDDSDELLRKQVEERRAQIEENKDKIKGVYDKLERLVLNVQRAEKKKEVMAWQKEVCGGDLKSSPPPTITGTDRNMQRWGAYIRERIQFFKPLKDALAKPGCPLDETRTRDMRKAYQELVKEYQEDFGRRQGRAR